MGLSPDMPRRPRLDSISLPYKILIREDLILTSALPLGQMRA